MELALAGRIVEPPVAKLHPFLNLGAPTESKYGLMNGNPIASTAPTINQFKLINNPPLIST